MPKLMDGQYPMEMVDKYKGERLIVVGGARCVWDDLARMRIRGEFNDGWHVLCVNDIVMHYPGAIEHFYSNDHGWTPKWLAARRELHIRAWGRPKHIHSCRVGARWNWPWPGHGTSTLNAVYTGLAMGYDQIVICGAPLDDSGHYFDPPWVQTNFVREVATRNDGQMMYWANANKHWFNGKVKSMSGRTRELIGGYNP